MKYRRPSKQDAHAAQGRTVQRLTWWQQLWMARQSMMILAPALCLMCGTAYLMYAHARSVDDDLVGASTYSGTAVVTRKYVSANSGRNGNFRAAVALEFRVAGHITNIDAPLNDKSGLTTVGQSVTLTYRVGKSGAYYVVDWQPYTALPH